MTISRIKKLCSLPFYLYTKRFSSLSLMITSELKRQMSNSIEGHCQMCLAKNIEYKYTCIRGNGFILFSNW